MKRNDQKEMPDRIFECGPDRIQLDTPQYSYVVDTRDIAEIKKRVEGGTRVVLKNGKCLLMSCPIEVVREAIKEARVSSEFQKEAEEFRRRAHLFLDEADKIAKLEPEKAAACRASASCCFQYAESIEHLAAELREARHVS